MLFEPTERSWFGVSLTAVGFTSCVHAGFGFLPVNAISMGNFPPSMIKPPFVVDDTKTRCNGVALPALEVTALLVLRAPKQAAARSIRLESEALWRIVILLVATHRMRDRPASLSEIPTTYRGAIWRLKTWNVTYRGAIWRVKAWNVNVKGMWNVVVSTELAPRCWYSCTVYSIVLSCSLIIGLIYRLRVMRYNILYCRSICFVCKMVLWMY